MFTVKSSPKSICSLMGIGFVISFPTVSLMYPKSAQIRDENQTIRLGYVNRLDSPGFLNEGCGVKNLL